MLHTKYISCGPHGFREEDLFPFTGVNDPQGVASLDLRGLVGRMYVGDYYTSLHTLSVSSRPHDFREEDF